MANLEQSRISLLVATLLALTLAGCGATPAPMPTPATPPGGLVGGLPPVVESIDLLLMESFPVQVNAVVHGTLSDACTTIDEVMVTRQETAFQIAIATIRPSGAICAQVLVPFEQVVSLDVYGLPAGTYSVEAHGVTQTFSLDMDNVLPEATP